MPIHDWSRVTAGTFHDFHGSWITHLKETLNAGLLPDDYYALSEQVAGQLVPDVLTFQQHHGNPAERSIQEQNGGNGAVCLLTASPPQVRLTVQAGTDPQAARRR